MSGGFFERYFSKFEVKPNGEANVLCPFPHAKGLETRPSAHVNTEKRVFHCKTCQAEGRFDSGGLSEVNFIAHIYNVPYVQAVKFISEVGSKSLDDEEMWHRATEALLQQEELMEHLAFKRGLTKETVEKYRLGYLGDGIVYPVFINGVLADKRTYAPFPQPGEPKMRSKKGATPLLFPFDEWYADRHEKPTILQAGENDTLLSRQLGYNALTATTGEGRFPEIFLGLFKGLDVYIMYDCDEPGRNSARRIAFLLKEAGANVYIVDLGLEGTPDKKDLTDFIVKLGKTKEDVNERIKQATPYMHEQLQEDKNKAYPLVDLWDVANGEYSGKSLSTRVIMLGKYDMPMEVPSAIEWACKYPTESMLCRHCPQRNKSGWWTLENENLYDLMELVEVTPARERSKIYSMCELPEKCPGAIITKRVKQKVQKVIFAPDVETEDILSGFRQVEQYAYVVGDNIHMNDGQRYRVFFRRYAHKLQNQRVFMVVDRVEDSDNPINSFKMIPEIKEKLTVFQGNPKEKMAERAERARDIVGVFAQHQMIYAVDLMYHSPLQFKFNGRLIEKGFPEILVIGETRSGKSNPSKDLLSFYGLGNFTACKQASTAGLLGGADKLPSGGHKIRWGEIPRNHKGLLVLDELSGMSAEVLASLTDVRSSGIAKVSKIVGGRAPALTRLLWISNPRKQANNQSTNMRDYNSGVQIVQELVGTDEDIARFDLIMLLLRPETYTSPLAESSLKAYDRELYRNLIYWVWSRNADQIKWDRDVEEYIWQVSVELNERYDCDISFFGAEAWKKLARLSVATAGCLFSCTEDGNSILVTKEHVDWARDFMVEIYDDDVFNLSRYVARQRAMNETNEAINTKVAGYARSYAMLLKTLLDSTEPVPMFNLNAVSGLDRNDFSKVMNELSMDFLVKVTKEGVSATRRLRRAVEKYNKMYEETTIVPLTRKGSDPF